MLQRQNDTAVSLLKIPLLVCVCIHIRERVVNTSRPGEMQVTIQNLMPDTKYRFRVVGHNSNGQGESSAALKVATQAEGKDSARAHTPTHTLHVIAHAQPGQQQSGRSQFVGTLEQTGCMICK